MEGQVAVRIKAKTKIAYGEELLVCGSVPQLGSWKLSEAANMQCQGELWSLATRLPCGVRVELKLVQRPQGGQVHWYGAGPGGTSNLVLETSIGRIGAQGSRFLSLEGNLEICLSVSVARAPKRMSCANSKGGRSRPGLSRLSTHSGGDSRSLRTLHANSKASQSEISQPPPGLPAIEAGRPRLTAEILSKLDRESHGKSSASAKLVAAMSGPGGSQASQRVISLPPLLPSREKKSTQPMQAKLPPPNRPTQNAPARLAVPHVPKAAGPPRGVLKTALLWRCEAWIGLPRRPGMQQRRCCNDSWVHHREPLHARIAAGSSDRNPWQDIAVFAYTFSRNKGRPSIHCDSEFPWSS
eukprot:symbB.v1.2.017076.t1/scaffold1283.1/size126978/15